MQKIFKNKYLSIFFILILLSLIILIRAQENNLFYDPFLQYFKQIFQNKALPEYNFLLLIFNYFVRFGFNTLLSLAIIYLIFKDLKIIKLLSFLYLAIFIILIIILLFLLYFKNPEYNFALFYVRRFIIQPVFLILFVPAIYFQRINKTSLNV